MDPKEPRTSDSAAGGTASPWDRARLKQDLDNFVDLMDRRVFDRAAPAGHGPRSGVTESNDN